MARYRTVPRYHIGRAFAYFDSSSISASDTITSATFSLYGKSITNEDNDGLDYIGVVEVQGGSVGSDTALATGDYNDCGDAVDNPTKNGSDIDFGSISLVGYNDWSFSDLTWVAKSGEQPSSGTAGITYLGFREGHDIEDTQIATGSNKKNDFRCWSADDTGTSRDPKLVVVHSAGASFTPKAAWFN